jgi:hypothetical protein
VLECDRVASRRGRGKSRAGAQGDSLNENLQPLFAIRGHLVIRVVSCRNEREKRCSPALQANSTSASRGADRLPRLVVARDGYGTPVLKSRDISRVARNAAPR